MRTDRIIERILEDTDLIGVRFRSSPRERAWTVVALGQRDDGKKNLTMERGTETKTLLEATFRQHYYRVGGDKDLKLVAEFERHNYPTVEA